jgi:ribonuclease P protein component
VSHRVTGRSTFGALARARRVRRGCVSVAMLSPDTDQASDAPARVAYAVGRRVGGAVVRNRVRRRLRAAVHEHEHLLEPGATYLVSAGPQAVALSYATLVAQLAAALGAADRRTPETQR